MQPDQFTDSPTHQLTAVPRASRCREPGRVLVRSALPPNYMKALSTATARSMVGATTAFLALLAAACHDQSPISRAPTRLAIVSGSNQSGDPSAALAQPLVVEALDGANRAVAGVAITWTVTGGGSLSAQTSTTGADGTASVTWTLAPTIGVQVATATSAQVSGAAASFVANNGATISGTVAGVTVNPFTADFARTPRASLRATLAPAARTIARHPSPNRIIVGFKSG